MTVSTIILAAGKGTRMKSPTPKILHKIAGKQLIAFSVDLAKAVKSKETIIVVGEETEKDDGAYRIGTGYIVVEKGIITEKKNLFPKK